MIEQNTFARDKAIVPVAAELTNMIHTTLPNTREIRLGQYRISESDGTTTVFDVEHTTHFDKRTASIRETNGDPNADRIATPVIHYMTGPNQEVTAIRPQRHFDQLQTLQDMTIILSDGTPASTAKKDEMIATLNDRALDEELDRFDRGESTVGRKEAVDFTRSLQQRLGTAWPEGLVVPQDPIHAASLFVTVADRLTDRAAGPTWVAWSDTSSTWEKDRLKFKVTTKAVKEGSEQTPFEVELRVDDTLFHGGNGDDMRHEVAWKFSTREPHTYVTRNFDEPPLRDGVDGLKRLDKAIVFNTAQRVQFYTDARAGRHVASNSGVQRGLDILNIQAHTVFEDAQQQSRPEQASGQVIPFHKYD